MIFLNEGLSTLTQEAITTLLRNTYPHLAAEYGVKRIGLLGSYAKDISSEAGDIDLVVEDDAFYGKWARITPNLER
jgi:predicted nucleotidyltransferase